MVGILAQVDDIFSWAPRGGKLIGSDGECAYKAMGTLTSYVGAIFVGRPLTKGSTGFCWINIRLRPARERRRSRAGLNLMLIQQKPVLPLVSGRPTNIAPT